jgi:hypothetical protein
MEKPLLVLVDAENQTVTLMGAYNVTIPLHDFHLLNVFVAGRSVIYVSQAEEVDGGDVVDLVSAIAEEAEEQQHEPVYLHYVGEGYKRFNDIKVTFSGIKDAKQLNKLGYDVFEKSPQLVKSLLVGEIAVLTESEAKALKKPRADLQKAKDAQLDSMILNKKEDVDDIDNIFSEDKDGKNENDVDSNPNIEVMTEAEEMIRKEGFGRRE